MHLLNLLLLPVFCILFFILQVCAQKVDPKVVKCHVCKATIHEMELDIAKIDPKRKAEVLGRLDPKGNSVSKTVQYSKSEIYLTELMENVCDKMDDYAKVRNKRTGKVSVIKFMVNGAMNPDISDVDFIQDGDLNKSLKHYCLEILDDHDEAFLKAFTSETQPDDIDIQICSNIAAYCKDAPLQDEYNLEEDDEYKSEL